MSEMMGFRLEVKGWPREGVQLREEIVVRRAGAGTRDVVESVELLDLSGLAGLDDPEALDGPWSKLAHELSYVGLDDEHEGIDGDVASFSGELNYGLNAIENVLALLQECGLAYFAQDDPKYEFGGSFYAWRPGWQEVRAGSWMDGPVMSASEWQGILAASSSLEDAARRAGSYFDARREALGELDVARALEGEES